MGREASRCTRAVCTCSPSPFLLEKGLAVFTWVFWSVGGGDLSPPPCPVLWGFCPGNAPGKSGNRSEQIPLPVGALLDSVNRLGFLL